ncbi:MAG: BppU family phage baseplate upper protein [[Clostridium] leptum]
MVYKEIEIDSTWQQPLGEIRVIQEEADGRELRIYLYDNGSPLDLTGKTVSVYIQKPDNTMIYNSCDVEGNQATVTLTLQMMAVSGLTKLCELQIVDTDNHTLKVTLPPLRIVKSSSVGAVESTDEFSRLAEALNEANNATGIASEAADKANEAAQSANTAAQAANTAAQSANTAADAAASAAESANSQAQAAQTQAAYAKTQGDYAKTQGENAEEIYNQLKDIDVASLQADLDALEASKGQPNGLATLNSSGKLAQMPSASDVGAVPTTRTVNGKALSSNISLTASDVGAVPTSRKVNGRALSSDINITSGDVFAQTTTVENGTNFNNLKNPGIYVQSSNAEVTNNTNMPTKEAFIMTVYMANWKDNSIQVFCNYTGSKMYWRTWQAYGDVWGAWRQVIGSNGGNATINNRLQLTGTQYPQIYGNGTSLQLGVDTNAAVGVVLQGGIFREAGDGSLNLGNGSHRWAVVYAKTGSINTSDRNEKNTIADIDPEQAEKLIMGLKPSTFKFNDGTSGRTHWGLISQDIEELLPQIGMSDLDFAGFIKTPKTEDYYEDVPETVTDEETGEEKTVTRKELKTRTVEGEYIYSLRYDEFIAPLICMVQKQQKQIENLERRLSALENKEEAK